ncbi:TROVE domain-containing protein [Singulisphaera sp. PoT]|uniref:TROVE domain-containing protein n=1 Tax=Singulisphaera sp. PoT TaxID=3411797 RepID=UPI003BF5F7DC
MSAYSKNYGTRQTPQTSPIPGKAMVENHSGGYSFAVDKWARLRRFLVLGAEGGSYYCGEKELVLENCEAVRECIAEDAARTVREIVEISDGGRAPNYDPAIFALAMVAGLGHTDLAMEALPSVCRIGTHLFAFAEAVRKFRGWGRRLARGVAAWYEAKSAEDLAFQVAKYRQRNGISQRDMIRFAHPKSDDLAKQAVLRWAATGMSGLGEREVKRLDAATRELKRVDRYPDLREHLPRFLAAFEEAKVADRGQLIRLIREENLPRECVPTEHLNSPEVWEVLLETMPLTAMIRNLGKMTSVGLLQPLSDAAKVVADRLGQGESLRKSRVHPLAILIAATTYASGRGFKGQLAWSPVSIINDALDAAFYAAFGNVEPANRRTMIALDVSGSMSAGSIAGTMLTPREASAAFALIAAKTEPDFQIVAFAHELIPLDISRCSRLADVVKLTESLPFGGTDCALPMLMAIEKTMNVDTFITLTDSESWAGKIHASQALVRYRQKSGLPARAVCVGMVANDYTVLDPKDPGSLNVVGFDAAAPQLIAGYSAGRL